MAAAARDELRPGSARSLVVEGFASAAPSAFGAGPVEGGAPAAPTRGAGDQESGAAPRHGGGSDFFSLVRGGAGGAGGGHGRQLRGEPAASDDEDFDLLASSHDSDEGVDHSGTAASEWMPGFAIRRTPSRRARFGTARHTAKMCLVGGSVAIFAGGVSLLLVGFFQGSSVPRLRTSGSRDVKMGRIESWQVRPVEEAISDDVMTVQGGGDMDIVGRHGAERRSSRMEKAHDKGKGGFIGKSLADVWGEVSAMGGFYNPLASSDRQMPKERYSEDDEEFDCMDTESWIRGWTQQKKNYCCSKHGVGCKGPPPPPSDNVGERTYDCHRGRTNWMYDWSPDHQAFCCRTTGFPCEGDKIQISDIANHDDAAEDEDVEVDDPDRHAASTSELDDGADDERGIEPEGLELGKHHAADHTSTSEAPDQDGGGGHRASGAAKADRRCKDGEDMCPASWKTDPSGGFYCRDNHGCRSRDMGPWDPVTCAHSCAVGNVGPWADEAPDVPAADDPMAPSSTTASTTKLPVPGMSLYCWSLASQAYEKDIMRKQLEMGAGIFSCDQAAIVTFAAENFAAGGKNVMSLAAPWVPVGRSKDGTAGNALQFMKAWETVKGDTRWMSASWMVKADPDAVILAERIRWHLKPFEGQKVYLRNCDKPMGEGPMMFGAIEVISAKAMATYYGSGERCMHEVPWQAWGEDLFMMRCLEHLGVGPAADFNFMHDGVCKGVWCNDGWAAAFHPMKSVDAWANCYAQATSTR